MKDLGPLTYCLGIEVERLEDGSILLHQSRYVSDILAKHDLANCNPVSTPQDSHSAAFHSSSSSPSLPFRTVVGELLYLTTTTRPDIAFTVTLLSRHLNNPAEEHQHIAKRVLRYLRGSKDFGICYSKQDSTEFTIELYVDADYANDAITRRSTSGYLLYLNGCLISWKSKLQNIVALSTSEAEYISMSYGLQEALWLKSLLEELQLPIKLAIIVLDGVDVRCLHQALDAGRAPNLQYLRDHGVFTDKARNNRPAMSLPNWATIFYGAGVMFHGVTSNEWTYCTTTDVNVIPQFLGECSVYPDVFTVLKQQNPDFTTAMYYTWPNLDAILPPDVVSIDQRYFVDGRRTMGFEIHAKSLCPNEMTLADRGYMDANYFVNPRYHPQSSAQQKQIMTRHETVNARLKQFGGLRGIFHHSIEKHPICFYAIAYLVQIGLEYESPLYSI
ncbi:hypothetical protein LEN26_017339 [Aphanomyces euteiches]|nr:hypothetical protein LEN26_017339 [Aphanomyces euteiches]